MADYSNPYAETDRDRYRSDEEQRTGFRTGHSGPGQPETCLGCGCLVGDKTIHRSKCPWTPKRPTIVYVED